MKRLAALLFCLYWPLLAGAGDVLTIEVTQGAEGAMPIAVVPFGWQGAGQAPEDVAAVVASDLRRSGLFAPLPEQDMLARPHNGRDINFRNWRLLGLDSLVVGGVSRLLDGRYEVRFQLFDVNQGAQLAGYSFRTRGHSLRRVAHHISDIVYEKLTGQKGAFTTHIAYVMFSHDNGKPLYRLLVADVDGYNPQSILRSADPLMSPAWSPDARRLAYVSFENKRPAIYVQEATTGKREKVAAYPGINGAPAWSPDGRKLALTLSRDGNPEIYVLELASRKLTRLTRNLAIDTEPVWSADGRVIVFTSDRGGQPQLYEMPAGGGEARRLTFKGKYNARASLSLDGRYVASVMGDGERYRIAVLDREDGRSLPLTDGPLDESPSIAPNGRMIIYANGKGELAAVSVDGRVRQRLMSAGGEVREPAWSPRSMQ